MIAVATMAAQTTAAAAAALYLSFAGVPATMGVATTPDTANRTTRAAPATPSATPSSAVSAGRSTPAAADLTAVSRIGLEGPQLVVRQALPRDGGRGEGGSRPGPPGNAGSWGEGREEEGQAQEQIEHSLKEEETQELPPEVSAPVRPQLGVPTVLPAMERNAQAQVQPQAQAPQPPHGAHQQPPAGIPVAHHREERRKAAQAEGPGHVDPVRSVRGEVDQPR